MTIKFRYSQFKDLISKTSPFHSLPSKTDILNAIKNGKYKNNNTIFFYHSDCQILEVRKNLVDKLTINQYNDFYKIN